MADTQQTSTSTAPNTTSADNPQAEGALTPVKLEHFGTGGFFFAAAILEGLIKKGVLSKVEAQEIVGSALNKVRASQMEEISGASSLFMYFYGAGQGYQTPP